MTRASRAPRERSIISYKFRSLEALEYLAREFTGRRSVGGGGRGWRCRERGEERGEGEEGRVGGSRG